jgi:hypothetical protein
MIIPKDVLVDNIKRDILDNSVGAISPQDIRRNLLDLIDSVSLLTEFNDINALNISTEDLRTVRVGKETLSKRNAVGYRSVDNVGVGYSALSSQIDAIQNTAVGSYALSCNMYGEDNVGVGFHSLSSTINGFGNIGLGSFALSNNKEGNFNIALGHGAGYYVDRDIDYQFFVAAHPVDSSFICANPLGSGLKPLLKGDLSSNNLRLGIGIRDLHEGATLQIGGHTIPHVSNSYNLGSNNFRFNNLYLYSSIVFPEANNFVYNSNRFFLSNTLDIDGSLNLVDNFVVSGVSTLKGAVTTGPVNTIGRILASGHVLPKTDVVFNLGDTRDRWLNAYTYNLYCDGVGHFKKYQAQEHEHYRHKTLFLASTGDITVIDGGGATSLYDHFVASGSYKEPQPYLLDEELNGAGFEIGASGLDYLRNYEFTFRSSDSSWDNLSVDDEYSRNSWFSNISIQTEEGRHVKTDRVINKENIALVTYEDGLGLFINSGTVYLAQENDIDTPNTLVGIGNINFVCASGQLEPYEISIQSPHSGVNLFTKFLTNTSNYNLDNLGSEIVTGFKTGYIANSFLEPPNFFNEQVGQRPHRYIISSYNDTSFAKRCFTLMQDETEGYVGISNFNYAESMLPDTIFNIRSTGNAIARITAENNNDSKAGIQLLGAENCLHYGISFEYIKNSGSMYVTTYNDGVTSDSLTINDDDGTIHILNKNTINAMMSIGSEDNTEANIAFHESSGVPVAVSGYGYLFVRHLEDNELQSSTLSFLDSSGNLFTVDLTASSADGSIVDKPLSLDDLGNTFGGIRSPELRTNLTSSTVRNTSIGYEGLSKLTTGDDNTSIGYRAGKNVTTGSTNVFVGSNNGLAVTTQSNNIFIGSNLAQTGTYSETFLLGYDTTPLLEGSLVSNKHLNVNGYLRLKETATKYTNLYTNYLLVKDNASQNGGSSFSIKFSGSNDQENSLVILNHNNAPLTNIENFASSSRPYAQINGDLRVKGSIRFSNNTSINDASFLETISTLQGNVSTINNTITQNYSELNTLKTKFDDLIIEGIVEADIRPSDLPNSFTDQPLKFFVRKKIVQNNTFVNAPANPPQANLIEVVLRDPYLNVRKGDYVIAIKVNNEYRPISITGAP